MSTWKKYASIPKSRISCAHVWPSARRAYTCVCSNFNSSIFKNWISFQTWYRLKTTRTYIQFDKTYKKKKKIVTQLCVAYKYQFHSANTQYTSLLVRFPSFQICYAVLKKSTKFFCHFFQKTTTATTNGEVERNESIDLTVMRDSEPFICL